jgi:hypothetical protein
VSCHSLSVDHGIKTATESQKQASYSQTVVMRQYIRSMLVQCRLPTDIHMKVTYLPVHLLPFQFSYAMCSLTKMHTQKCGNFETTRIMISPHVQSLYFRACLENDNVSECQHFECDPHRSADLTQRSRLFICVETNS